MSKRLFLYAVILLAVAFFATQIPSPEVSLLTGNVVLESLQLGDLTPHEISIGLYKRNNTIIRFHLNCLNQACVVVAGAGKNRCKTNADCSVGKYLAKRKIATHKGCKKDRCVVIYGEGTNATTCTSNDDCKPKKPAVPLEESEEYLEPPEFTPTPPKTETTEPANPPEPPAAPAIVQEPASSSDSVLIIILKKLGFLK